MKLNFKFIIILIIFILSTGTTKEIVFKKSVINGDFISLRSRPNINSDKLSTLFNNQSIQVISTSTIKDTIDDHIDFWFEVKVDSLVGWIFGKYLNINVKKEVDTYSTTMKFDWFNDDFGELNRLYYKDFSLEQYRCLISEIQKKSDEKTISDEIKEKILYYAIYSESNEILLLDEPPFQYLKKKLFSPDFICSFEEQFYNVLFSLPDKLKNDPEFILNMAKEIAKYSQPDTDRKILMLASDSLRYDLDFLSKYLLVNPTEFENVPKKYRYSIDGFKSLIKCIAKNGTSKDDVVKALNAISNLSTGESLLTRGDYSNEVKILLNE